jgi:hypothetical protein
MIEDIVTWETTQTNYVPKKTESFEKVKASPLEDFSPQYKFNELSNIRELKKYVDSTYSGHYARNKFQSTEFIVDNGHGVGFMVGNVMKYVQRYGKKGTVEDHRKDIMKVLHYALMLLYVHDLENAESDE